MNIKYRNWAIKTRKKIVCQFCKKAVFWAQIIDPDGLHIDNTTYEQSTLLNGRVTFGYSRTLNAAINSAKATIRNIIQPVKP